MIRTIKMQAAQAFYVLAGPRGFVLLYVFTSLLRLTLLHLVYGHHLRSRVVPEEAVHPHTERFGVRVSGTRQGAPWGPQVEGGFAFWRRTGVVAPIAGGARTPAVPASGTAGPGYWDDAMDILRRARERVYDVKDYGAVLDNVQDETTNLQDAHDDAAANGGGIVFAGPGTAPISGTLTWSDPLVSFLGAGGDVTTIRKSGAAAAAFTVGAVGVDNMNWFRSFSIDGNSEAGAGIAVSDGAGSMLIEQVKAIDCADGLTVEDTSLLTVNGFFALRPNTNGISLIDGVFACTFVGCNVNTDAGSTGWALDMNRGHGNVFIGGNYEAGDAGSMRLRGRGWSVVGAFLGGNRGDMVHVLDDTLGQVGNGTLTGVHFTEAAGTANTINCQVGKVVAEGCDFAGNATVDVRSRDRVVLQGNNYLAGTLDLTLEGTTPRVEVWDISRESVTETDTSTNGLVFYHGMAFFSGLPDNLANRLYQDGDLLYDEDSDSLFIFRAGALRWVTNKTVLSTSSSSGFTDSRQTIRSDASGAVKNHDLPDCASSKGKVFTLKKTDSSANAVNLRAAGTDTIDGSAADYAMTTQNEFVTVQSHGGTNWTVIGHGTP